MTRDVEKIIDNLEAADLVAMQSGRPPRDGLAYSELSKLDKLRAVARHRDAHAHAITVIEGVVTDVDPEPDPTLRTRLARAAASRKPGASS